MDAKYLNRVEANILPLSELQTLPEAFEEWSFTGEVVDHEDTDHECELCDNQGLRYHFMIGNSETGAGLWIGSSCILRFDIAVYGDDGARLSPQAAERKLTRLIAEMRHAACLKSLAALAAHEGNDILKGALAYLERNGHLTPKQAWVVLSNLKQRGIAHSPEFFKIKLRTDRCRRDLRDMEPGRVHTLWPALSASQRKTAIAMGHTAPPPLMTAIPLHPAPVLTPEQQADLAEAIAGRDAAELRRVALDGARAQGMLST
jgi:hypothetical protein